MTTTYAWGATGMRQIDDPEKVNVAFVQHEDFARVEAEVARLKDRLEAQFKRLTSMDGLLANADARIAALEADLDTQNRALAQCRALLKQECDDVVPLRDKVAALEAERDAWKSKLLAEEVEHDATMAERDAALAARESIEEFSHAKTDEILRLLEKEQT